MNRIHLQKKLKNFPIATLSHPILNDSRLNQTPRKALCPPGELKNPGNV